ncbi:hypothetical protein AS034_17785 [[Bacillus] enclensis]|jgi:hypothetical protein|nr:hypothetical protein AS034_17785 [[Bacillus] enclensis]
MWITMEYELIDFFTPSDQFPGRREGMAINLYGAVPINSRRGIVLRRQAYEEWAVEAGIFEFQAGIF